MLEFRGKFQTPAGAPASIWDPVPGDALRLPWMGGVLYLSAQAGEAACCGRVRVQPAKPKRLAALLRGAKSDTWQRTPVGCPGQPSKT